MNIVTGRLEAIGITVLVASLIAGAVSATEVKHSCTITAIAQDRITLQEMGPWSGAQQGLMRRSVAIGAETRIELSARSEQPAPEGWPGGFRESARGLRDLHVGDYVTVTTDEKDGRAMAKTITITPPAEEAPSASLSE